jgi:hypothetical protein
MKKVSKITAILSFSTILALSLSSCTTSHETHNGTPTPSPSVSASNVPREPSGDIGSYKGTSEIKDPKKFSDNNYLATSVTKRFTITETGTVEKDKLGMLPAEGEIFHAVNYTYNQPGATEKDPGISVTIDGKTQPVVTPLNEKGFLTISAPEKAEVLLNLKVDGVTQSINLDTAERKSLGIADAWYGPTEGKVENGKVSNVVNVNNIKPTLEYSVLSATRTPYVAIEDLGWADEGKKTWVVIDITPATWKLTGSDSLRGSSKASLIDADGNSYSATVLTEGVSVDNNKLAFKVPVDKTSFKVLTENSSDFEGWGNNTGNTGIVKIDQVKITFEGKTA